MAVQWKEGHNLFQAGAFYSDFSNYMALLATGQLVHPDEGPVPECSSTGVPAKLYGIELESTWCVLDGPNGLGMSRPWALELAPFGITANVVAPGPVQTDMLRGVVPVGNNSTVEQIAAGIPVRRLGQPTNGAHAVRFFCAERAGFVTGQVLYV